MRGRSRALRSEPPRDFPPLTHAGRCFPIRPGPPQPGAVLCCTCGLGLPGGIPGPHGSLSRPSDKLGSSGAGQGAGLSHPPAAPATLKCEFTQFRARVHPPISFRYRGPVRRASRDRARRPWPVVNEGGYWLRRVPRRSSPATQPRGWLVLAGPSWQCEPLAPPDMTEGGWGTGRHLPLKFDAPWCPRVPHFELGPAIT